MTLSEQAAQLAYLMKDRLKDAAEKADKEKDLKDITEATAKEKTTAAKNAKATGTKSEEGRA